MVAYIALPGTSGSHLTVPDVNLLTSNQAHAQQGHGLDVYGNFSNSVDTPPTAPLFGSLAAKMILSSDSSLQVIRFADGTGGVATSPTDVRSMSMWWYTDQAGLKAKGTILWNDSGGNFVGANDGSYVNLTQNAWTEIVVENKTAPASTAYAGVQSDIVVIAGGNVPQGTYWTAARCVRAGTDSTFVPSLRIVGDLDLRAKFAATDATPTSATMVTSTLSGNNGYALSLGTGGELVVYHGTGSGNRAETSSGLSITDASVVDVRSVFDISAGTWTHYKNGVQFDSSGSFATTAGSPSGTSLIVGSNVAGTGSLWNGDIYYVEVRDGIDGPVVARMDADDWVGVPL